jgi:glycosyltransferase involved in cell wall biosynthesis
MKNVLLVPDLPIEHWPSMDRYAHRLVHGLSQVAPEFSINLAGSISGLTVEQDDADGAPRPRTPAELPSPHAAATELLRYWQRYVGYPRRVRRFEADLVHVLDHSYAHVVGRRKKTPTLVTVHDLHPVLTVGRTPANIRERIRQRMLQRVLRALRGADGWIVSTHWLRGELAKWLGDDDGIDVIPYGVDEAFSQPSHGLRSQMRELWHIPETAFVVLHVGSVDTRKNYSGVIAAVDGLRHRGIEAWLLQVGGALTEEHSRDINARNLADVLRTLGRAGEPELRAAYRAADVLLFPSHYEGFGLPVLEAMASGLPVVTSGAGGLAEVAGDAAIVVGSREVEPYVAALERLAGDEAARGNLVRRGVERTKGFSWAETARRTANLYRRLT